MISTITGVRERRCVLSKRPKSGHFVGVSWFVRFFLFRLLAVVDLSFWTCLYGMSEHIFCV